LGAGHPYGALARAANFSWLGGSAARTFMVFDFTLGDAPATPDERLDRATQRLVDDGNRVIWQSAVNVDDARARDVLFQSAHNWMRMRIIVTAGDVYLLQATANSKPAILDDSVTRFLMVEPRSGAASKRS